MDEDTKKWGLTEEQRQRINLSHYAYYVMQSDVSNFGNEIGKSEYMCRILLEFGPNANATLSPAIRCQEKGEAFNIRVRDEVEELIFRTLPSENTEIGNVYSTPGKYIKEILEEYFRLPEYKREEIIYRDTIRFIQEMIDTKTAVKIKNKENAFVIRPYKFVVDPSNNYNYLICFSRPSRTDKDKPVSLRLSRLAGSMLPLSSISGRIKKDEAAMLENRLSSNLPSFFIEDNIDVTVKLTDRGIGKINRIQYMRPHCTGIENGNIYHFCCTKTQAENYFIRLGADAEILAPESLRITMRTTFKHAFEQYNPTTKKR